VLADSHHFFREGLRGMLETAGMTIVGEATDSAEALALAGKLNPDLVVIDLNMPGAGGAEALRRIAAVSSGLRMIVLTASDDEADVLAALEAGACSYILKDTLIDELVDGIRQTAAGYAVLSQEIMQALVARARAESHHSEQSRSVLDRLALTAREMDVLRLIVGGADNATIGLELSISRHTVKQHVTNIFEKLGVRSRVEAAVYAVRAGLL
jgi:two-component system, NarL family, nitrate/nitrite response regulator NarL